jgi:hypothetical protein
MQQYNNGKSKYEFAEEMFDQGLYKESFAIFKKIALDENLKNAVRGDAYNMLGAIMCFDPSVDPEDESGLKYFSKALELDPENIGALFNIVTNFGSSPNNHENVDLFNLAVNRLLEMKSKLSVDDIRILNEKLKEWKNKNST